MIQEEREVIIIHPTVGDLRQVNLYTWDQNRFPTWEEANAYRNGEEIGFYNIEFVRSVK
jgi:hypothetical protein